MPLYDELPIEERMLRDLRSLPRDTHRRLRGMIHRLSIRQGLTYQRKAGVEEVMGLIPLPAALPLPQVRYLSHLCREIIGIVKRIVPLYLDFAELRGVLPLLPREEEWLRESWHPKHLTLQPIIYRLDADVPLASPDAAHYARFFESNSVAVGGMVYAPVAESIICDATLRMLYRAGGVPSLRANDDTRLLILKKLASHARALGRRGFTLAFVEDKSWDMGITEMPSLVRFCRGRGVRAYLADPRELSLRRGELCYRGRVIDIVYRNCELRDLLEIEDKGMRLSAMREAFRRNQMVSSISGEFDHKSLLEIFSSEQFSRLFTPRQEKMLALHIPWTRLIYERRTMDPQGRRVDLLRFIEKNRERLVIKPNRHCGGEGVHIGPELTQGRWEKLLQKTIRESREWVVQKWIDNKMKLLPRWAGRGYRAVPMYTTYGFISTPDGFGMVGRACTKRIVNVASGGALMSVFKLAGK
ncbi:MAG: hypothetical protein NTZ78_10430 [Candidatus Aureabacteria bacterium]|nr:hypothetical protein [Candidatus Auribacterota bacterium]